MRLPRPAILFGVLLAATCHAANVAEPTPSWAAITERPQHADRIDDTLSPDEQCRVALMYLNGEGVARDPGIGLRWLRRAAERAWRGRSPTSA